MVFTEIVLMPTLFIKGGELMPFNLLVSTGIEYLSFQKNSTTMNLEDEMQNWTNAKGHGQIKREQPVKHQT